MLNPDGRVPLKINLGYVDVLRQERTIPADIDVQKFVDFSMLPASK